MAERLAHIPLARTLDGISGCGLAGLHVAGLDLEGWSMKKFSKSGALLGRVSQSESSTTRCMSEQEQIDRLKAACELTLLFHSGSPWTFDKQQEWTKRMYLLIPTNDPKVVGSNNDGTWDRNASRQEATTKNLCNAVRAALNEKPTAEPAKEQQEEIKDIIL